MHLVLVGLSHHIAPIAMRERVNCSDAQLPGALTAAAERPGIREVAMLSTCNRMEVYALVDTPQVSHAYEQITRHLAVHHHVPEKDLTPFLYMRHDQEVVLHLMRVSAGLDSLVLGEAQILGQVKGALRSAQAAGTIGSALTGLFQQSISAGRRTQAETGLGKGAFSIGHAAVDLAGQVFGEQLSKAGVLILGAGKMSEVTARHLRNSGVSSVLVANRTYARAEALAGKLGGRAIHYDSFPDELCRADIVIASTAAPHPIITRATLAPVMRKRRGNPLILIDIAVPRDIDENVSSLDNVFLYNIDALQSVVAQEAQGRQSEVGRAETILADECAKFMGWYRNREAAPVITLLRQKLDTIRAEELSLLHTQLPGLTDREWQKVEAAFRSMSTKFAKEPILRLKRETVDATHASEADAQTYDLLTATREIFNLPSDAVAADTRPEQEADLPAQNEPLPVPVSAGRPDSTHLRWEVEK